MTTSQALTTLCEKHGELMRIEKYKLKGRVESISHEVAEYYDRMNESVEAWLPSGRIQSIDEIAERWPFIPKYRIKHYASVVQLCDVIEWFNSIYSVQLTAGEMWAWHSTVPVVALMEGLLYEVCLIEQWIGKKDGFHKCIGIAYSKGVIDKFLHGQLNSYRRYRNEIHLYLRDEPVVCHDGDPKEFRQALDILRRLEIALNIYYEQKG